MATSPKKIRKQALSYRNKVSTVGGDQSIEAAGDFSITSQFHGYRNKEDKTNLPPGYLVEGSKNVLSTTGGRVGVRKGYTLDGQDGHATLTSILGSFDTLTTPGNEVHLRAGNSLLQYRYVANAGDKYLANTFTAGQIYWITLQSSTTSDRWNFTNFFDTAEKLNVILGVNGRTNIYEWNGAVTTMLSATAATITKTGTSTWAASGFYVAKAGRAVVINGNTYTYTGGEGTTTLTGVTPSPAAEPVQSVVHQAMVTTANSALTNGPGATFPNALIENLYNQIYLASLTSNQVWISKVNNYTDFSFAVPRAVGEGAQLNLKSNIRAFVPQEDAMYVTAGKDLWYQTKFTLSSDNAKEELKIVPLKTSVLQAARSQAAVAKIKNSVFFLNNETSLDELGRVADNLATPQATNISDPIKNDFDMYNFADAACAYHRNFLYVSVPMEGIVRVFNIEKGYWEAPLLLPISRFAIIDGLLYGHSYNVMETYRLFDGYNDNGNSIDCSAVFSYENYGTRSQTKSFNEFYQEGYISSNTTLTTGIRYEIGGCATDTSYELEGTSDLVCSPDVLGSLGKESLGKLSLGGSDIFDTEFTLPPKFRLIYTFNRIPFYEVQYSFSSNQVDATWEILAFGPNGARTIAGNNNIKT